MTPEQRFESWHDEQGHGNCAEIIGERIGFLAGYAQGQAAGREEAAKIVEQARDQHTEAGEDADTAFLVLDAAACAIRTLPAEAGGGTG